uniref:Uncharacterized protein n=1 Tax=Meloidogyne enterolobii TaxID=390850 RepID=A0A6V7UE53_MELEN|nr:unnamed protein product [Meloidogyne enterolobii]
MAKLSHGTTTTTQRQGQAEEKRLPDNPNIPTVIHPNYSGSEPSYSTKCLCLTPVCPHSYYIL